MLYVETNNHRVTARMRTELECACHGHESHVEIHYFHHIVLPWTMPRRSNSRARALTNVAGVTV